MKKFIAIIAASVFFASMSVAVFASTDDTAPATVAEGDEEDEGGEDDDQNKDNPSGGGSCGGSSVPSVSSNSISAPSGEEVTALEYEATGVSWSTWIAAADENKSLGEYMNNAITSMPGLENATPVGQGGNVIINGQPSNQTFSVFKPVQAHVDSAKAQASSLGGRVLNVVDVKASVSFETANVNFYMPGITGAENVQVYHYADGQWYPVNVSEVREDHVLVDMTQLGVLAFIEVPAAE